MSKDKLLLLTIMLISSLFPAATWADVSGKPNVSANGIDAIFGEIKNAKACGDATFFKNAFPSLSNSTFAGSRTIEFTVAGKTVPMTVTWDENNSFGFVIEGGYAKRVGVTVDTNNFIYDYSVEPAKGVADSQLNYYGGVAADDVNHLDLCLELLDNAAPDVSIRVEPSSDGTTISGEVNIIATVRDESSVNPTISIVSLNSGADVTPDYQGQPYVADCDPVEPGCSEYTWPWDTTTVPPGEYKITIGVTDTSVLLNETTKEIIVSVSVENCLEGADGVPDNQVGIGGCNPSGFQIVELPNELGEYGLLDGKTISQIAAVAQLQTDTCGGPEDPQTGLRPYEYVAQDPRVDPVTGAVILQESLDLSTVFDLSGFDVPGADAPNGVWLRADTVGSPCLAMIIGDANFSFAEFYDPNTGAPLQGTGAYNYAITQLPELVPGITTLDAVGDLQPNPGLADYQPDLQFVQQSTYQPDDRFLLIENEASPFTSDVINPSRQLTPDFSWFLLNTREACLALDPALPYFEAVLQCKIDLAIEYFDNLELAVIEAGPNLLDPSLNNLLTDVNKARSMVKVRYWDKANTDLTSLYNQVVGGLWVVDERNDPGILLMRIKNLFFRVEQLELAESALP